MWQLKDLMAHTSNNILRDLFFGKTKSFWEYLFMCFCKLYIVFYKVGLLSCVRFFKVFFQGLSSDPFSFYYFISLENASQFFW